jgi:hypothetical protein
MEEMVMKRLQRKGRLFSFLRRHRHELLDDAFQAELEKMYRDAPRGAAPRPPALLALVTLLQAYEQKSDAAAVEEVVFDRRWQLVLDCMGTEEPIFSQGVLVDFRRRLMEHQLDKRLLERTVELAKETGSFGYKQLQVALDSSPLWGAGRVEDTFNLLGHALEILVRCASEILKKPRAWVLAEANLELLQHSSLKAALDIDWDNPSEQAEALERVLAEVRKLREWLDKALGDEVQQPPVKDALALIERVTEQDLEPDPNGGGHRLRRGVARDRRISATDAEMRHGRKSKSRVINGYKRHLARELTGGLILAASVRPANEPEALAGDGLRIEVERFGEVSEIHIDRAYLSTQWARDFFASGKRILAKPWPIRNGDRFPKTAFELNLDAGQVTCPERKVAPIHNTVARFSPNDCDECRSRERCTTAKLGRGRTISIHPDEHMLIELRRAKATPLGRKELRRRVHVEHSLAHVGRMQGPRARYRGTRKNTFDVRRVAAVINLQTLDRLKSAA